MSDIFDMSIYCKRCKNLVGHTQSYYAECEGQDQIPELICDPCKKKEEENK